MEMKKQDLMKKKNLWFVFVFVLVLAGFVVPVFAGGWATTTIDSMPDSIKAGETARIKFTILQHGKTPVHTLYWDDREALLTPIVTATLADSTLEFEAQPAKEVGHWFVDITLPEAGAWDWSIDPKPLGGATQLEPITVVPAAATSLAVGSVTAVPMILSLILIGLVIVGFVWWRRRRTAVVA
jgi:hypothetical protein